MSLETTNSLFEYIETSIIKEYTSKSPNTLFDYNKFYNEWRRKYRVGLEKNYNTEINMLDDSQENYQQKVNMAQKRKDLSQKTINVFVDHFVNSYKYTWEASQFNCKRGERAAWKSHVVGGLIGMIRVLVNRILYGIMRFNEWLNIRNQFKLILSYLVTAAFKFKPLVAKQLLVFELYSRHEKKRDLLAITIKAKKYFEKFFKNIEFVYASDKTERELILFASNILRDFTQYNNELLFDKLLENTNSNLNESNVYQTFERIIARELVLKDMVSRLFAVYPPTSDVFAEQFEDFDVQDYLMPRKAHFKLLRTFDEDLSIKGTEFKMSEDYVKLKLDTSQCMFIYI